MMEGLRRQTLATARGVQVWGLAGVCADGLATAADKCED